MNPFRCRRHRILRIVKPALMLAVLAGGSVFAQWSRTSPNTYLTTSTDNVGIGLSSPTYKLDVNGTFHIANGFQAVFSNSGTAALPSITFYNDANTGLFNPGNADVIGFATQGTERMRINQAGVVGIGTTNPGSGYKLDVNGVLHVTTGNQALFSYTSTANAPSIAFDINNNTGVYSPTDDNLCLATGGQERVRINPNGYVGIGTTNPGNGQSVVLHTNGSLMMTNLLVGGTAPTYFIGIDGSTGLVKTRTPMQVFSDISGGACPPNPMTALGDMMYGGTAGACTRLVGNLTATKKFLSQTGTGTVSAIPAWTVLTRADVGLGNVENTALSTWVGSANITTLGTISSGSIPWARITGAPTIPAAQVNSDWAASSGVAQILNKPTTLAGYGITDAAPLNHGVTPNAVPYASGTTTWGTSAITYDNSLGLVKIGTSKTASDGKFEVDGVVTIKNYSTNSACLYIEGNENIWGDFTVGDAGGNADVNFTMATCNFGDVWSYGDYYNGLNLAEGDLSVAAGNLTVDGGDATIKGVNWTSGNSASLYLGDSYQYIRATNGGGMKIGTYGAADAITLAENTGDVAITKGNLSVTTGKINVKGWSIEEAPDYVFDKGYQLPKLSEVEKFVKENKHLSEVPSAKEMNSKGVDLVSMNMKLLKKVEELTLYTIEQNKRIEALENRLEKK
jgi:hypothetical protein